MCEMTLVITVPLVYRFFKGNFLRSNFVLKGSAVYAIIQKVTSNLFEKYDVRKYSGIARMHIPTF